MKFGLFGGARARGGPAGDSEGYHEFIRYIVAAEELGFSSVFLVEHHFTGFGQVSASLNLLSYLAARTEKIRLGTAVVVLPWHNPASLAEQPRPSICCPTAASISVSARAIAGASFRASAFRCRKPMSATRRSSRSCARRGRRRAGFRITANTGISRMS